MKKTSNARLRRILAMIAALTILLTCLTACQKNEDDTPDDSTPPTSESTPPESTDPTETEPPETTEPPVVSVWGTVNTNNLNIRTSPSSTSTILGQFDAGTRVEILEQKTTDGVNWGRLEQGWVNLLFVNLDGQNVEVPEDDSKTDATTPTEKDDNNGSSISGTPTNKTGTVTATELNIRKGPDTSYDKVGVYKKGTKVTITETKNGWGKTDKGWISLKHVNTGDSSSSTDTDKDDKYSTLVTDGKKTALGKVKITIGALNVRYGPGSSYEKVTSVTNGTTHTYYQKSGDWVRIADGWIYTKGYTDMGETTSSGSTTGSTGTGTTTSGLNIRKEGNKDAEKVGEYAKGTKVTITEVKNGWGKTDKGWINLKYVQMDSTSSSGSSSTTTEKEVGKNTTFKTGTATVEVNSKLTIRKEAKSDAEKVGSYNNGTKVTILKVENTEWGQTDKGWINLRYVKFD